VTASTIAMLVLISLGSLLGLPRFANTLGRLHKGTAWVAAAADRLEPAHRPSAGLQDHARRRAASCQRPRFP